jgi:hypothetical protein
MSRALAVTPASCFAPPAALRALAVEVTDPQTACRVFGTLTRADLGQTLERALDDPSCRCGLVGDALVADLSLAENMHLRASCIGAASAAWLETELQALFAAAGAPIDPAWLDLLPGNAPALACLHARVGRALAADPDWLLVDADAWGDALLAPERFVQAFEARYPWRGVAWLSADAGRTQALRARLESAAS